MNDLRFEFSVVLVGFGRDAEEAWNQAIEAFTEDPGFPGSEDIAQVDD